MRILVLSFHVPPDSAVGALRVGRVIDAFRRAGHEVEVVGARLPHRPAETLEGVPVHRAARWPNARELVLRLRGLLRERSGEARADPQAGYVLPDRIPRWKRFLIAMALMPDDHQGFILPAATRALRLMSHSRVDLLYTSGPPHSVHVAGLLVNLLTGVRWVSEFRDPWTDNAARPRYASSEAADTLKRWLERATLRRATRVVAVTEAAGNAFAARSPSIAARVIVARNGIDDAVVSEPASRPTGPTQLLYLGNLYHRRDPRPLLCAIATLLESGEIPPAGVRIDFYGECRFYRGLDVRLEAQRLGLDAAFKLYDAVPRREAVRLAATADILLLLAQAQPLQVPNKLYEYLAAARPILAFADADGETALMLRRVGGHFLVHSDDARETLDVVRAALAQARGWRPPASAAGVLTGWSARHQMDRLVAALTGSRPDNTVLHQRNASRTAQE